MQDFHGHILESELAVWKPRSGQWVLFRLTDLDRQVALVQMGAHATTDGSLVAIYAGQHVSSPVEVRRANGSLQRSNGEVVPARLILVDANGNNLSAGVRNPKTGHIEIKDIFFFPSSPSLKDLRPLEDLKDMPPGRVIHPDWQPMVRKE